MLVNQGNSGPVDAAGVCVGLGAQMPRPRTGTRSRALSRGITAVRDSSGGRRIDERRGGHAAREAAVSGQGETAREVAI